MRSARSLRTRGVGEESPPAAPGSALVRRRTADCWRWRPCAPRPSPCAGAHRRCGSSAAGWEYRALAAPPAGWARRRREHSWWRGSAALSTDGLPRATSSSPRSCVWRAGNVGRSGRRGWPSCSGHSVIGSSSDRSSRASGWSSEASASDSKRAAPGSSIPSPGGWPRAPGRVRSVWCGSWWTRPATSSSVRARPCAASTPCACSRDSPPPSRPGADRSRPLPTRPVPRPAPRPVLESVSRSA